MVGDVDVLEGLYLRALGPPLVALVVALGCVVATALMLPAAALVLALGLLVGGLAVPALALRLGRAAASGSRPRARSCTAELVELLRGAPELVAYGREEETLARVRAADAELARPRAPRRAGGRDRRLALDARRRAHGRGRARRRRLGARRGLARPRAGRALALLALASFEAVTPLPAAARELSATLAAGGACSS